MGGAEADRQHGGLEAAFDDFETDPTLHVAIFTGAGERAFCTGLDLKVALPALNEGDAMGYEDPAKRPFQRNFKPIITAVNGMCVAGGLEFMLGTDIRIAAEGARFMLPEVGHGVIPDTGGVGRLRYADRARVSDEIRTAAAESYVYVADAPVLAHGRIELLWYLKEQSLSHVYHRYGNLGRRAEEPRSDVT